MARVQANIVNQHRHQHTERIANRVYVDMLGESQLPPPILGREGELSWKPHVLEGADGMEVRDW